ncbi:hypothetical protein NMR92_001776 [Vibrio cholerae]|uniref:hypothetical protein n=1 Tax=Vibrio cholerae TaxID=666 RepID=UPI000E0DBB71|nr:hypothetical protein [Vibrio cholerae]EGQ8322699.1 hypothetical protein [Vibrio cholerae]EGR0609988.1 hypothetical protein [Vibrio cholerae]EGR3962305.1 hypothetical protein [Vibrio cholerae]EIC2296964.1 hypothetical protein [Vibrio cholerae]EJL6490862.1 hypothetical protein [Vibrio cholerae]
MNILKTSCHHIFIGNGTTQKFHGTLSATKNFQEFAKESVKQTQGNVSTQEYIFNASSGVKTEFENYLKNPSGWEYFSETMAGYLLVEQQTSQAQVANMKVKLTPGSLLVIHCKPSQNDIDILVLVKIEQEEVANAEDFEKLFGLPVDKKALNTAFITFEKNKEPQLLVSKARAYWTNFLDVSPIRLNSVNTANAFDAIDGQLKTVKRKYKADHLQLRNHLLTYLRNRSGQTISYSELIEVVFENHQPLDSNFKPKELAKKLIGLPKSYKKPFDSQFNVDMADVNAKRVKQTVMLTDKIELNINDAVDNLEQLIQPYEKNGEKGIVILSEYGYEHFKKSN